MGAERIVVDLGQCDPDHASIKRVVESLGVSVVRAHTKGDVERYLAEANVALVLVNRVLDIDGSDGMAIIKDLAGSQSSPVMLVSNYPEYQDQAVQIGARPGFGKSALREPHTLEVIRKALSSEIPSR
jgi:response regulator RpfG family c-di-GMP phosphodiesterase